MLMVAAFAADNPESNPATAAVSQADSIPACTESAKPFLLGIREQLEIFSSLISEFKTVDDIVNYAEVHNPLARSDLEEVPACQEAMLAGQLLIQATGDTVPAAALLFISACPRQTIPSGARLAPRASNWKATQRCSVPTDLRSLRFIMARCGGRRLFGNRHLGQSARLVDLVTASQRLLHGVNLPGHHTQDRA